jgi:hypothetical protein
MARSATAESPTVDAIQQAVTREALERKTDRGAVRERECRFATSMASSTPGLASNQAWVVSVDEHSSKPFLGNWKDVRECAGGRPETEPAAPMPHVHATTRVNIAPATRSAAPFAAGRFSEVGLGFPAAS